MRNFRRRRQDPFDLEAELRRSRPEPRPDFVNELSAAIREAREPVRGVRFFRLAPVVGFTVLVLVGLGAFGGVAIATNGVTLFGKDTGQGARSNESAQASPVGIVHARPASVQYDDNVVICHNPDGPNPLTLSLPQSAVAGHLGHGDHLGPCVETGVSDASGGPSDGSGVLGQSEDAGGVLPFTGLDLAIVVLGGVALLAAGLILRRRGSSQGS